MVTGNWSENLRLSNINVIDVTVCTSHQLKKLLTLKGLSTLKWTYSGFEDYGLLIQPLSLIFQFGETLENGRDSRQKMSNPVGRSY